MIFTTLVFFGVLSILIIVHEWGHFVVARACGVRVEQFSLGFGPPIVRWKRGDTDYRLCWILFGGYVKMAGEHPDAPRAHQPWEFLSKQISQRLAIVCAGPGLNYVLAWVAFVIVFLLGNPTLSPVVGKVVEGFPAQAAGIQIGDRITAVDGTPVASWDEMTAIVHRKISGSVAVDLQRKKASLHLKLQTQTKEQRDLLGRRHQVGMIGISPSGDVTEQRYGLFASLRLATEKTWTLTLLTFEALGAILFGQLSVQESLTGPIGIFVLTGEAARLGIVYLIHLLGVLSLSLGIFNLFPIPVLDGGHVLFLVLEQLRGGRPVALRWQMAAAKAGLAVLLLLVGVIFYSDIARYGIVEKVTGWWSHK